MRHDYAAVSSELQAFLPVFYQYSLKYRFALTFNITYILQTRISQVVCDKTIGF